MSFCFSHERDFLGTPLSVNHPKSKLIILPSSFDPHHSLPTVPLIKSSSNQICGLGFCRKLRLCKAVPSCRVLVSILASFCDSHWYFSGADCGLDELLTVKSNKRGIRVRHGFLRILSSFKD